MHELEPSDDVDEETLLIEIRRRLLRVGARKLRRAFYDLLLSLPE